MREAAVAAGAVPVQARITAVDADGDGIVRAVIASDGRRLAADVVIGADGALSPLARLAGMLDPDTALWGFAIRAYLPAEVPLPLLVLLDARPWRIYPGYGWLFPGADGQANVGIGVGLGTTRRQAPLRGDLAGLPPACIVAADFDPLRDEGVAYARALEAAGVPVRLARARGHTHTSVTMVDVVISGAPVRAGIGEALRDFFPSAEPQEQVS